MLNAMVRRHTASHDQTQFPRCVAAPNTRATRHNGKAQWHAGGGPVAHGNAGGGGHRGRVARPQTPDKTAHRLQHNYIERAWVGSQIACELRRVMRTNPQSTVPWQRNMPRFQQCSPRIQFLRGDARPTSVLRRRNCSVVLLLAAAVVVAIASTAALPLLPPPLLLPPLPARA